MPVTAQTLIVDTRSRLDEITARFWTDVEILAWLNEGNRDLARRTETLEIPDYPIPATPNVGKYALPADCLRVNRVEWQPVTTGTPQIYPMELRTRYEMDQRWGSWQLQQRSFPDTALIQGRPPNLVLQAYPVPSQTGNFNVTYYGLPAPMINLTDVAVVSEGWWDVVEDYATYRALMKDRDPRWKDFKQLYEEGIANLIDVSRVHHDQGGYITMSTGFNQNTWGIY